MKLKCTIWTACACMLIVAGAYATPSQPADTTTKKGVTLIMVSQDTGFPQSALNRLRETFFTVYPKLTKTFNKNAAKEISITIDTAYDGVAYAHNGKVTIAQTWLEKHPGDVDVVTHEVMHIVQAYPPRSGPGWLIEGIADYVRHKYGVNNAGANWTLPELKPEHHYTSSYRISARFLDWIERNRRKGTVKKLDQALREQMYNEHLWEEITGSSLDELWNAYIAE
jgi:Plant Basic Secretory Protein.